jgi:hypothetical protein
VRRASSIVGEAAAFSVVVCARFGVPLLVLTALLRRSKPPPDFVRAWLLIWSPMLTLGIVRTATGLPAAELLLWPLLAVLGGLTVASGRVMAYRGALSGLLVVTAGLVAEHLVATRTWSPANAAGVSISRYAAAFGPQVLRGPATYERVWRGSGTRAPTLVTLDVRLRAGAVGWSWYAYDPDFVIEPLPHEPTGFARITPPDHGGSYVTRRVDTGAALAGRTFRARLRLRAAEPFETPAPACRGVLLREVGGSGAVACFPTSITTEWSDIELTWQVPDAASSSTLRIELRMPLPWFDVGEVHLEESTPAGWRTLGPLEPAGVRLTGVLPNAPTLDWITAVVVPTPEWQSVALRVDDPRVEADADLRVLLRPEAGTEIEVRDVAAQSAPDASTAATPGALALRPLARPQRRSAWFEHPNLAGHSLALAGLLAVSSAPTGTAAIGAAAVALGGVALTGSRTAWLVAIVGATYLLWRRTGWLGRRRRIMAVAAMLAAVVLVGSSLWGPTPASMLLLGRGAANEVTRPEILAYAFSTMLEHPLRGIGDRAFDQRWAEAAGQPRTPPRHGHNFWLHYGAAYGVPGFLVAIWVSGGLLLAARRWGGRHGTALVGFALLLQTADFTLSYAGVFAVLLFAFRQRCEARRPGH